jgi:segregation and condensation protein A
MDYQVALDAFHGPLDLLLFLVKRHEIDLRDIPILQLTEQYRDYLAAQPALDLDRAGDFLLMSATLLEIKSKLLLPPRATEATPTVEADPRIELVKQLLEYRQFKEAAGKLEELATTRALRLARQPIAEPTPVGPPELQPVELWDLVCAFGRLLRETHALQPQQILMDETPLHIYQGQIRQQVQTAGRVQFRALFAAPFERGRVTGIFLALLDLIKSRDVLAEQPERFGAIWLTWPGAATTSAAAG